MTVRTLLLDALQLTMVLLLREKGAVALELQAVACAFCPADFQQLTWLGASVPEDVEVGFCLMEVRVLVCRAHVAPNPSGVQGFDLNPALVGSFAVKHSLMRNSVHHPRML